MKKEELLSTILASLENGNENVLLHIQDKKIQIDCIISDFKNYFGFSFDHCDFTIKNLSFNILNNTSKNKSISFNSCKFDTSFFLELSNLNQVNISDCSVKNNNYKTITIEDSNVDYLTIQHNPNNKIEAPNYHFEKVNLHSLLIKNIDSKNSIRFTKPNNIIERQLQIDNCSFESISLFDITLNGRGIIKNVVKTNSFYAHNLTINKTININNNKFKKMTFDDCFFYGNTSMQDNHVDKIELKDTFFSLPPFLDNLQTNISNYNANDIKTVRTIKQQLQKTENRIDYDKFRSYELELYKKELQSTKKWWNGDLLILKLNSLFSNHGTSWGKALKMTLLFAFGFYSILYFVKNWQNEFDIINGFNHFTSGYFKFMLVTNFYDPLSEKREFLSRFVEWIPFIFGKVFIGYGLYETIQAFRKYRK
ncbi:hypothetical protein FHR24_001827 [Wenyingzhuangia heitensis]|uniref:Pentapeptide repeat-containing protein n=1 Tax=Wenyingzhuangia heitensis TaxID=1487859 RepID=A0ABX0U943_9FLAO|nr:hypothetical protein [Wenyingzhuangia heitensis]NIJ45359.1 hypothetical protein [Wenyingzhuangia heitensis]